MSYRTVNSKLKQHVVLKMWIILISYVISNNIHFQLRYLNFNHFDLISIFPHWQHNFSRN